MSEDLKEDVEPNAEDFDLQIELSSLVADQIIPQSIAERLEKKLVENQVEISKDQLHKLAEKIHSLIISYKEKGTLPDPSSNKLDKASKSQNGDVKSEGEEPLLAIDGVESDTIEGFMNKIEEIQQKIDCLEQEKHDKSSDKIRGNNQNIRNLNTDIELPYEESISTDHLTTDPLQAIPSNPESIIVLMNWMQYLVNRCGHEHLANVLDYYVEVDWIADDVKISLLEYATGITEGKLEHNDAQSKDKQGKRFHLHSKDHIQSYLYIQRLKGKKFEKHFVERINGELARIEKKVDTYYHTQ